MRRSLLGLLVFVSLGWSLLACGTAGGDASGSAGSGADGYGSVETTVAAPTRTISAGARSGSGYGLPVATVTPATTTPKGTSTTPAVVTVRIVGFRFEPVEIVVGPGTTVEWVNGSTTTHTVAAKDGTFASDLLEPGQRFRVTFDSTGTFEYWCTLHPEMVGRVIVR